MARRCGCLGGLVVVAILGIVGAVGTRVWYQSGLTPTAPSAPVNVRFERNTDLQKAFEKAGPTIVRDPFRAFLYARLKDRSAAVRPGTYVLKGGMTVDQVIDALREPVVIKFRFPEQLWSMRNAERLEKAGVCSAEDYMRAVKNPSAIRSTWLPKNWSTLEGFLLPDTYEFEPGQPAESVVLEQLDAFKRKIYNRIPEGKNLKRLLTIASLVELEAGSERDRALIAGVIENRIKKGMPLQIDASLLYGLGKWRRLTYNDYRTLPGPYNLYRVKGLPPTPICSPSWRSVQAAMRPAKTDALYYVAIPGKGTVFSRTYDEHLVRVKALRGAGR